MPSNLKCNTLVLYPDECRTKKAFKYVNRMLPLFRAVVKFCSTNRLFRNIKYKMFTHVQGLQSLLGSASYSIATTWLLVQWALILSLHVQPLQNFVMKVAYSDLPKDKLLLDVYIST